MFVNNMSRKNIFIYTILIIFIVAISCNAFEKSEKEVSVLYAKRYEALKNSKVLIIDKNTGLYSDLENFSVIKTLKYKDEVTVLETHNNHCYEEGRNLYQFYKVKTKDNKVGWLKTSSFLFPYTIKNNEVYGVGQEIIYDKELEAYMSDARIVYHDGKKKLEKSLYSVEKRISYKENGEKYDNDLLKHFDPTEIEIKDINGDKLEEVILKGRYTEVSIENSEGFERCDAELLYNIRSNKFIEVFLKKIYSYTYAKIAELKYYYDYLDLNKDGFKETIDCKVEKIDNQANQIELEVEYNEHEITTVLYEYTWDGEKYIFSKEYLTPSIDNLRLRESPSLEGKFIRMLKKGERLEYLEKGESKIIDKAMGNWTKVKTDQGEIGWCFDYYLEAWQRK